MTDQQTPATDPESAGSSEGIGGASFRKQVIWQLAARLTAAVLQIVVLVLLARGLPPSLFALVISVNVLLQLVVAVNGFGLLREMQVRRSRDPQDASLRWLFMVRLQFTWASAVLWLVGCGVAYAITGHEYVIALTPAAVWLLVEQITQVWNAMSICDGRSRELLSSYIARRLPVVVVLAVLLFLDPTSGEVIWTWTIGLVLGSLLSYLVGFRTQERWARHVLPRRAHRDGPLPLDFGYWWGLVGIQVRDLDVAAAGLVSATVAGIYAFPARLVAPMNLVTVAVASQVFPAVARNGITRRQLRKGTLYGLAPVTGFAVVTALLAPLLPVLIGSEYDDAVPVLRLACITAVMTGAGTLLGMIVQALSTQDARFIGYLSLGAAVVQVVAAGLTALSGSAVAVAAVVAIVNTGGALAAWFYGDRRVHQLEQQAAAP